MQFMMIFIIWIIVLMIFMYIVEYDPWWIGYSYIVFYTIAGLIIVSIFILVIRRGIL